MSRIKLPNTFLESLLTKLNEQIESGKVNISNRHNTSLSSLKKALQFFIVSRKDELSIFYSEYMHKDFPSLSILQRAFNRKTPNGATARTADILCLYLTDGKLGWKEFCENGLDKKEFITPIGKGELLKKYLEVFPEMNEGRLEGGLLPILSDNDPSLPEFPPPPFYKPMFPATPIVKMEVEGLDNVWLKDESHNPTGTHKDRMAWEITIQAVKNNWREMSLISSGGAASAIQHLFNLYGVRTKLKVLMDEETDPVIVRCLEDMGCKVFSHNLKKKILLSSEIKELTGNTTGVDITYRSTLDGNNMIYYDWLSYEILNLMPSYCIVPFGTGDLYINLLNIVEKEVDAHHMMIQQRDPRFQGDINKIRACNFIGVRATHETTQMDKLYAAYLPTLDSYSQKLHRLKLTGSIGEHSCIKELQNDAKVAEALEIASMHSITTEASGISGLTLLLADGLSIAPEQRILIVNTGKVQYPAPI